MICRSYQERRSTSAFALGLRIRFGGNWVMHIKGRSIPIAIIPPYGLEIDVSRPCVTFAGAIFVDVEVCRLRDSLAATLQ